MFGIVIRIESKCSTGRLSIIVLNFDLYYISLEFIILFFVESKDKSENNT